MLRICVRKLGGWAASQCEIRAEERTRKSMCVGRKCASSNRWKREISRK